jgi:DNA-binding MarR family transcriptional regulator
MVAILRTHQAMTASIDATLALDQLEKRKLVKRSPHPTDRRTILAVLTPAGHELLDQATKALADADFGLAGVDGPLSGQVVEVLGEVRQRIGDIRP